jgi:hypothetical protein
MATSPRSIISKHRLSRITLVCSGSGGTTFHFCAHIRQNGFQRIQAENHIFDAAGCAHQAKAPYFSGEIAEPCANLKIIVIQQTAAHFFFIDTSRYKNRIQLRQAMFLFHHIIHAQGRETGFQRFVVIAMTRPGMLQILLRISSTVTHASHTMHWSARYGDKSGRTIPNNSITG